MPRTLILRRVLWGGVALGLLAYAALTLWLASTAIFFPYQLDYGEGIVLWLTRQLALGQSIYKGLEGLPYASSNYPPLGMALAVPFRTVFGDSYIGGRWLNFASALVVTAFAYRIVRAEAGRVAAVLGALFFFGSTFVYHWVPLFRVDLIGLAFNTAGIFFVWRWQVKPERSTVKGRSAPGATCPGSFDLDLGLAVLLFLAAICTKHSLVFGPTAAAVAIFIRSRRSAMEFVLALGLSVLGIFALLESMTQGGLIFGLITSNATVWLWSTFLSTINDFLWTYLVLIALALWGWFVRMRERQVGVLEIYAIAAVASLALAGRIGAWENYYLEAVFVICVFAGLALAPMVGRSGLNAPVWLPVILLIQLALFWREHDPAIARQLMDVTRGGNLQAAPLVLAAQGTVISEDMGLLVTNGKPVDYYTFQYSSLARAGLWDQHWELENLRAGAFPLVILFQGTREDVDHFRDFTREFVSNLDLDYGLIAENDRYKLYEPAPLAHSSAWDFGGQLGLVGWTLSSGDKPHPGQDMIVTIVWKAEKTLDARYTAFAHLEDGNGAVVAQDDHEPEVGVHPTIQPYPTTRWNANEMVRDNYVLRIPSSVAPGKYSLRVGWYNSVTQDRIPVVGGGDLVDLTVVDVVP